MEWNEKLQMIIDYVENHLQRKQEPVDAREISKIAECSFDFFQKVFSYMNGISFSEYVRCRKMTLAGYALKSTDRKVVDISYQFGYDSPTSFTKAFQQFHGAAPKEARNQGVKLRVLPKMQISVKQQFFWRLEQKPALRLIGKSIRVSSGNGDRHAQITGFWDECQNNGVFSALVSWDTGSPKGLFGLYRGDEKNVNELDYFIMVQADGALPEGCSEIILPETVFAVFDCRGAVPRAIQNGWRYLQEEWLEEYPFEHAQCPEIEWYSDGNSSAGDYLSQIWIPVVDRGSSEKMRRNKREDIK